MQSRTGGNLIVRKIFNPFAFGMLILAISVVTSIRVAAVDRPAQPEQSRPAAKTLPAVETDKIDSAAAPHAGFVAS